MTGDGVIRALHLVSSTDRRGAQVFATQLAAELGGPPDHPVVAIEPGTAANRLTCARLGERRTDPRGLLRLVAGLRHFDVLVAHGSSALLHGAVASALTGRPFVYRNIGDPSTWGAVRGAGLRIGAPLRRAAAVSALYPAARDHLLRAYDLDPDRVVTIPNGVPAQDVPSAQERSASRAALELDDDLDWVGFVGALSEEKGILAAVEAVAADARLGLVVAGDGPQRDRAERAARELAPGRVRFLGVTDRPRRVLAAADVVVLPSRTEGIPAVAIEAGLCARPVVATSVGGMGEVVEHGVTGLLVHDATPGPLTAALVAALADRSQLGAAARTRCDERFTLGPVARQWAELLDRVVAQRRPAASAR